MEVMNLSLSLSGSERCPEASLNHSTIINQWAVMVFSEACCQELYPAFKPGE